MTRRLHRSDARITLLSGVFDCEPGIRGELYNLAISRAEDTRFAEYVAATLGEIAGRRRRPLLAHVVGGPGRCRRG
jgi:hypothetical protein